jgi:beta-1,4-N-acetylglucosaminyltransferase
MPSSKKKTVFVTVGTTLFEPLVAAVVTPSALQWMTKNGYTHLIVQYGKGVKPVVEQKNVSLSDLTIELYDFKPSLRNDMLKADCIICHAGAGTLMEALAMGKKVVAVINTALMDNHQAELAYALSAHKLLFVVESAVELAAISKWDALEKFQAVPYTGGDEHDVPRILDRFFRFDKAE